jgi:Na+/phosphate symporter
VSAKGAVEAPPLDPPPLAADDAPFVPALPAWLHTRLPARAVRPTALTAHTLRIVTGSVIVLYLFVLALRLLAAAAGGVADLLQRIDAHGPLNLLGFGWLLAYGALSGSPVAALALSLLHGGAVTTSEALGMVSGSRFGASMVVLLVGFIAYLRGRRRPDGIYVGVLALLTTATIYAPATLLGLAVLKAGWLHGTVERLPLQWDSIATVAKPLVTALDERLPAAALFALGIGALLGAFWLFDRLLPNLDPPSPRIERLSRRFDSPRSMFLFGALITSVTMSVSLSVTILVPLTLKGIVRRNAVIPYIMGANITTFIDTLFASFLVPGGGATEVVVVEMLSVTAVSLVVLTLAYRPYQRALLAVAHRVSAQPRWLAAFLAVMTLVPMGLLLA